MAGIQEKKAELEALGATIIAGSVDAEDKAKEAGPDVTFPIAHSMTQADADAMRAWWGDHPRGKIIQPCEFIIKDGKVVHSLYASGPVGRMLASDIVANLAFMAKQEAAAKS